MKIFAIACRIGAALSLVLGLMLGSIPGAHAKDAPIPAFEDTVQINGQNLVLNGSGQLSVNRVKFYKVGFYLTSHKTAVPDVLDLTGPVRIKMVMLKSVESEMMSRRFIADIHANTSKDDRLKIANQILALGMGFGSIGDWNVGDIMTIDWIPGKGTVISWNGKQVTEPFKEPLLMQSIMRIWVGDNVYDPKLKRLILGDKD